MTPFAFPLIDTSGNTIITTLYEDQIRFDIGNETREIAYKDFDLENAWYDKDGLFGVKSYFWSPITQYPELKTLMEAYSTAVLNMDLEIYDYIPSVLLYIYCQQNAYVETPTNDVWMISSTDDYYLLMATEKNKYVTTFKNGFYGHRFETQTINLEMMCYYHHLSILWHSILESIYLQELNNDDFDEVNITHFIHQAKDVVEELLVLNRLMPWTYDSLNAYLKTRTSVFEDKEIHIVL